MLVIQLPPRARSGSVPPDAASVPLAYVLSADGLVVTAQGRAPLAELPRADSVIAVAPPGEIGWHRLPLPKAPAGRLRAALLGMLEEALLDDDEQIHLALAPQAKPAQPTWVAALHRPWIAGWIAAIEQAGLTLERVVPALWPQEPGQAHVYPAGHGEGGDAAAPWLTLADGEGVLTIPLAGGLARSRQAGWLAHELRWTAEPSVVAAAERWLGAPLQVQTEAESALAAARSPWNLRQFELAPHHRGMRAVRELAKQWRGPAWRPVRWGLAALVLLQIVGLNLHAWQQQRKLQSRQQEMTALLRSSHPQVRSVVDAAAQMQRETELLRQAAGQPGEADFEPLLALAARGWPDGQAPVQQLQYEPGKLSLAAAGWAPQQIEQFRTRVEAAGARVTHDGGRLVVRTAAAAGAPQQGVR
ncbi:type II secretion system protein GspL [Pseudaquabacterium terrae]|nr:type II secretion system protein GspL [Aquabacterium terrae]